MALQTDPFLTGPLISAAREQAGGVLAPHPARALEESFRLFNEVAGQLAQSYRALEAHAARLSEELAAARGERLAPLAEKERIAHHLGRLFETLPGGEFEFESVPVAALLEDARHRLEPHTRNGQVRIEISDRTNGAIVRGSRHALLGALSNLAVNALQMGGARVHVRITARSVSSVIELCVSDNGPGVPRALRKKIFEPFFTTRPDGTGLGLAVVKAVAEGHRGTVTVQSARGGGTRFVIRLPQVQGMDILPSGGREAAASAARVFNTKEPA